MRDSLKCSAAKRSLAMNGVPDQYAVVPTSMPWHGKNLGAPREAHPLRVGCCAGDLWLWARCALCVVQWSVVTLHVAPWSVVALREGLLVFIQLVVLRLRFVFKM